MNATERPAALDAALDRNARIAGQRVDWRGTTIASPRGGALGLDPFRQAADAIARNRLHDALDRAMDAKEEEAQRERPRPHTRELHKQIDRLAPPKRQAIAFDAAAESLLTKNARQFVADLAIGIDVNARSAQPWFETLHRYVQKLPLNATVGDLHPTILKSCIREML